MAQFLLEHSFLFTSEERELIYRSSSTVETRPVSFVTRVFMPIWRFLSVHVLSENVAPNAITLMGLLSCLQAYQIIGTYYHYNEASSAIYGGGAGGLQSELSAMKSLNTFGVRGAASVVGAATNVNGAGEHSGNAFLQGNAAADVLDAVDPLRNVNFLGADRTVQTATVIAGLLLMVSIACGSLDGVHAKRCRSATSLGDIFSRVCSSVSRVFIALTMLEVLQNHSMATKWYMLVALQLIEFNTVLGRINAENVKRDKVKNWAYVVTYCFRDSELSFLMLLFLVVRWCAPSLMTSFPDRIDPHMARQGYVALLLVTFANVALLKMKKRYKSSLALCLMVRVLPVFYLLPLNEYSELSVISDAMVIGLLSIEVYVSHLAHRRIHAAVIFLCIGSMFNDVLAIFGSVMYVVGMLVDLSYSLNVPLFVPICNVFIDGVFDLCHAGHKKMMANALKFGNRLIVGVCGDEDCEAYKRRPIMTTEERVNEVRLCKYVSEVIPNSPVSGITPEMIKFYNVHIVVCGEEYDTPTDTYYAVPRRMGILRSVPRTAGISTSVLIKRIRAASDDSVAAKDKAQGKSVVKEGE